MTGLRDENSYPNILRRISAFGGVQIFTMLISLLRGKFVALFLGPSGMGISTLYQSSTAPLQQLCSLGLNLAVVKEVAANKTNPATLPKILGTTIKLFGATALLGALVCAAGAPLWSHLTFGDFSHTSSYLWLSFFLAFSIAGAGFLALLQGLGEVKTLSKASLAGGLSGLLFGVPLYYFFGYRGIVPAMIISALSTFLFYYISYRRRKPEIVAADTFRPDRQETRQLTRRLISLGFILLIGALSGQLVGYLINLFIRSTGSIADVGLFQGANSVTNQYMGMILSALALDYFPRLSACCHDRRQLREVVNRQTEIVMLLATPLVLLLILTAPLLIRLLLTDNFLVIIPLMRWMGLGILIQIMTFPLGYIYVARGDRKAYILIECVWGNLLWLACSVLFYRSYGLIGLGIGFAVRGAIDIVVNYLVCRFRYGFAYSASSTGVVILSSALGLGGFAGSFAPGLSAYWIMGGIAALSLTITTVILLRKRKSSGSSTSA